MLQKILLHTSFYFVARLSSGFSSLAILLVYTHYLNPAEYGHYALINTGVGVSYAILFNWLTLGLERFYPTYLQQPKIILASVLRLYFIVLILTLLGGSIIGFICSHWLSLNIVIFWLLFLWLQAFQQLSLSLFKIRLKPAYYVLLMFSQSVLSALLGISLVISGHGYLGGLTGMLLGIVIPLLFCLGQWRIPLQPIQEFKVLSNHLLSYGLPLSLSFALQFIFSASDRYFLAGLLNISLAGIYAASYDLASQPLGVIISIFMITLFPLFIRTYETEDKLAAYKIIKLGRLLFLLVMLPAVVGMCILAPNISYVLLGKSFSEGGAQIMPWIAAGTFISGLKTFYLDVFIQMTKRNSVQVYATLSAAIINVAFNLLWIPHYGMIGSAYATTLSFAAALLTAWLLMRKTIDLPMWDKRLWGIIAAVIIMALILLLLRHHYGITALIYQIITGIFVYLICTVVFNHRLVFAELRNFSNKRGINV